MWPHANAIAWLGRLPFVAGVEMRADDGRLIAAAGQELPGNRTEIAMIYTGGDAYAFARVWADYPVTVIRTVVRAGISAGAARGS